MDADRIFVSSGGRRAVAAVFPPNEPFLNLVSSVRLIKLV
jgi:hypothetical protein